MKVLFLTNIPSPYRVDFFEELGKLCELTVLYERKTAHDRNTKWLDKKGKNFNEVFLSGIRIGNDSALSFSVIRWLRQDYDLIVVGGYSTPTGMFAIEYLRLRKIPFILNSDGGIIKNDSWIKYKIKKHFISKAMAWLSTGNNTNAYLRHYGANAENIYIYPFTSLKQEDIAQKLITQEMKTSLKNKLGITESLVVVSVGRFIYGKGFDVLLRASKNISKKIGVYIIGGKPTDEYLRMREEMKLKNLHFIDFLSKEELKKYYYAADLFVLPTRGDVWGLVINEAMACGLPVITTDKCIAGLELVKDYENGFIVPVDNDKQLAEKINIVLSDSELLNNMSQNSLEKIREYTIEKMVEKNMAVLNSILRRN